MRFVKVFALILFFVVSMMFFMQNNELLSQSMSLRLDLYFAAWHSKFLPFYFVILAAFLVGGVFALTYCFLERMRFSNQLKALQIKIVGLEKKLGQSGSSAYEYGTSFYTTNASDVSAATASTVAGEG